MADQVTITINTPVTDANNFHLYSGTYGDVTHSLSPSTFSLAQMQAGQTVNMPDTHMFVKVLSETQGTCQAYELIKRIPTVKMSNNYQYPPYGQSNGSISSVLIKMSGSTVADLSYNLPIASGSTPTYVHLSNSLVGNAYDIEVQTVCSGVYVGYSKGTWKTKILAFNNEEYVQNSVNIDLGSNGSQLNAFSVPFSDAPTVNDVLAIWTEPWIYPIGLDQESIHLNHTTNYDCLTGLVPHITGNSQVTWTAYTISNEFDSVILSQTTGSAGSISFTATCNGGWDQYNPKSCTIRVEDANDSGTYIDVSIWQVETC